MLLFEKKMLAVNVKNDKVYIGLAAGLAVSPIEPDAPLNYLELLPI